MTPEEIKADLARDTAGRSVFNCFNPGAGQERLRYALAAAYDLILHSTNGPTRSKSIALTKLEEAGMWALRNFNSAERIE